MFRIIVQDRTSLQKFTLDVAMKADTPMAAVNEYVAANYAHLHIVGRA
jgi:hypothetical protein